MITLTGINKTAGGWNGLAFDNCNKPALNRLVYCNIEYGGSSSYNEWNNACLSINGLSTASTAIGEISNCRISDSSYLGIDITQYSSVNTFSSNTITRNQSGPVRAEANLVRFIADADSDYSGNFDGDSNPIDRIYCWDNGDMGDVNNAQTWPNVNAVYQFGATFFVNADLVIEAGAYPGV